MNLDELLELAKLSHEIQFINERQGNRIAIIRNPETIIKLITDYKNALEVITSIASVDKEMHISKDYWNQLDHNKCAVVLANDTQLSREFLRSIK